MSGGYFDYKQFHIEDVEDDMKTLRDNIKADKKEDEYGFSLNYMIGDKEPFLKEVEKAINYLRLARIYTHRIDWLISGDDSPESFYKRLKEDLNEIEGEK